MFDSLQEGLQGAFKSLTGKGKLTESNMRDGLALVEKSLLEADVSYDVVQTFMEQVSTEAMGEKVLLALNPTQQFIGVVKEQLEGLLGADDTGLSIKSDFNILMMCGLQGSGKTTTCGKLATWLNRNIKSKPLLVAADLQRPAAIEQLHVIGKTLDVPVYSEPGEKDPVKVCQNAVKKAKAEGIKVVILDTAGRLAIDEELMNQLKTIDRKVNPDQVFLVVDGMTGQDAVNSAKAFNDALELNGVIMTKLDGDTRGGALLSVRQVTGVPVRFIGTGEHFDNLEEFRPEGMASRILGHGDMLAMVDEAQKLFDDKEQEKLQAQLEKGIFTLEDFRDQIQKMAKPGLIRKMMGMMPGMGAMKEVMGQLDDAESGKEIRRIVGIVDSMTPEERRNSKLIDQSRRGRIARGAGVQASQVNDVIKQYEVMAPMFTGMKDMSGRDRMAAINDMKDQLMDPRKAGPKTKKGTGRRLNNNDRKKNKKQREKELKRLLREKRKKK